MKKYFLIPFMLLTFFGFGQNVELIRTIYFPAMPNGDIKELKELVKQEMVYPQTALKNQLSGDVFITFLIDPLGKVKYKEVSEKSDTSFIKEASRIFDKIRWVADPTRDANKIGYEKIKFEFNPKKYKRLVKKRGYDSLPYGDYIFSETQDVFTINQVDVKPELKEGISINEFVAKNIKYPSIAKERGVSGRVSVEFIIEPYGLASNIRIVEALAGGCNEETLRLIRAMKWKPAFKDGKAVRTIFKYQLQFKHPGGTVR